MKKLDILSIPINRLSLIEASAGTGKTFTISNLFLRILLENNTDVQKILVVTFTEAATKELKDRIRKNLTEALRILKGDEKIQNPIVQSIIQKSMNEKTGDEIERILRKAVICFDEASIFTIHGFCKKILNENAFESSNLFDLELIADQSELIKDITEDFWRLNFTTTDILISAIAASKELNTSSLKSFADQILNKTFIELIPAIGKNPQKTLLDYFSEIKKEWEKSQDGISSILFNDKSLERKKGKYRADQISKDLIILENFFNENPTPRGIKLIEKYSSGRINSSIKKKGVAPSHPFFDLCENFSISVSDFIINSKQNFYHYLVAELNKRKKETSIQSFDDLLLSVFKGLKSENGHLLTEAISKNYDAAMIDEFQDTDQIQYFIFESIFTKKNKPLFLIGDPKQAIYGFRGADIFSYINAAEKVPENSKYTLNNNWRSETKLVEACNDFFGSAENPFVIGDAISYNNVEAAENSVGNKLPLKIKNDPDENIIVWFIKKENPTSRSKNPNKDEALQASVLAVVNEIKRILYLSGKREAYLGSKPVVPNDFAILVIKNKDAEIFRDTLISENIPAVISKAGNVFHSDEAVEIQRLLNAVANPGNLQKINTALATEIIGFSAEDIFLLINDEKKLEEYDSHIDKFADYHLLWQEKGFIPMFRAFLTDYNVRGNLLSIPNGERKLTNLLHLGELINNYAVESDNSVSGILHWLSKQIQSNELVENNELRLEQDGDAVQIITVFKSKGLQYPIVFCPLMWQKDAASSGDSAIFHENGQLIWDMGSADLETNSLKASRENLSELNRLLYVALTRAQNRCYLTYGKIGKPSATSLDFIFTGGDENAASITEKLTNKISSMDEASLFDTAKKYAEQSGKIRFEELDTKGIDYDFKLKKPKTKLIEKKFSNSKTIKNNNIIASFSMLSSNKKISGPDFGRSDETDFDLERITVEQATEDEINFSNFPKGKHAGSCIHDILENYDFSLKNYKSNKKTIEECLEKYSFESSLAASVETKITELLSAPLESEAETIILKNISPENKIHEMEFYFPVKKLTHNSLYVVFKKHLDTAVPSSKNFAEAFKKLEFMPVQGHMRGFIDLIFFHNKKYYIIDWKTNSLGDTYSDYSYDRLAESMAESMYSLQYYIYTAALHKYLYARLPGYEYSKDFGGVFYLYIRGIHPDHSGKGVYFDNPPKALIENICSVFDNEKLSPGE